MVQLSNGTYYLVAMFISYYYQRVVNSVIHEAGLAQDQRLLRGDFF